MYSRHSTSLERFAQRAINVLLVLVGFWGISSGARPVSAGVQSELTSQVLAGEITPQETNDIYLPFVLGPHTGRTRIFMPVVFRDYPKRTTVFGVQIYEPLNSTGAGLELAKQAGVSWIRWPISWAAVEPQNTTPDKYNWARIDSALLAAAHSGAKIILTIDGNPDWAATHISGPINLAPLSEFVQFVSAVVERYDGDNHNDAPGLPVVEYFEFYNEPDAARIGSGRWGEYGNDYAQMLCTVRPAVKAAQKKAMVLMGGIAYDYFQEEYGVFVREFLDDVLAAGGGQCMDYFVFHYYPAFEFRWAPYAPGLSGKAVFLRDKLQQYGVGHLPMMVTEAGFYSNPEPGWPSTERLQASYVVKFFTQAIAADIKALTWWTWTDLPGYYTANGLLTADLQTKEAYYAFQTAANKLGQSTYQRRIPASELGNADVEAYLFFASRPLYVIWAADNTERQIALPGGAAQIRDLLNTNLGLITDAGDGQQDGSIHLTVSATPIYVEIIQ